MKTQPLTASTGPDWDSIEEQIHCPLCKYDLRGLSEPRCPECGYTFEWPDMLDPARRLHRYIFEHHPEKNIRSFWKTTAGILRPRRFWRSLQPIQPSCPRRLMLYWLLAMLLSYGLFQVVVAGCVYYFEIRPELARNQANQAKAIAYWQRNSDEAEVTSRFGTIDNTIEYYYPTRLSWRIMQDALRMYWPALVWPLPLVFWPWLMFAVLMVFRWSMRRARVRPIHVLRCCIYTSGTVVWLSLATPILVIGGTMLLQAATVTLDTLVVAGGWLSVAMLVLLVYQLCTAYRLYLRFDHSIATVFCAQVVAALTVVTAVVVAVVLLHY